MKQTALVIILSLFSFISKAQTACVQHWSKNSIHCTDLDSMLASIDKQRFDTFYCDSFTIHTKLNPKWYTDFYTKHFGNYFSNPSCIALSVFYFKNTGEEHRHEMNIIQFVLNQDQLKRFTNKYGIISKKKSVLRIKAYTAYKYVVTGNAVYFVCTESYPLAHQEISFFEEVVDAIEHNN